MSEVLSETLALVTGPAGAEDCFTLFALPARLDLSAAELTPRLHHLQRALHPDHFVREPEWVRAEAERRSAAVNDCFRRLNDPVERAALVLSRLGVAEGFVAPDFLAEQMEWNERLEELGVADSEGRVALLGELDAAWASRWQRLAAEVELRSAEVGDAVTPFASDGACILAELRFLARLRARVLATAPSGSAVCLEAG